MGYYIHAPMPLGKAHYIIENFGATTTKRPKRFSDIPKGKALICVVTNLSAGFEAAAFAINETQFKDFTLPEDKRPKQWLLMSWDEACKATGYKQQPV
jgi:hypothetical protein